MVWKQVRMALLAGVLAAAVPSARAEDEAKVEKLADKPAEKAAVVASAPLTRTVCVKEWVAEPYQSVRTVYRTETRQENYTAYRCETTSEVRQRNVTTYRMVPEVRDVVRRVCVSVPHVEERQVMKAHVVCRTVQKNVRRCVDRGHWECREVPCEPSFKDRLKKRFKRSKDCCDPCCEPCCPPPTKIVRVWVPCKVWEEVPVTCVERVCEYRPEVVRVCTHRHEWREERCQVTTCRCVPEQRVENYTVLCKRMVPYQAVRNVCVSTPHQEVVNCTRMVCRTVERQVPVTDCCESACSATTCCAKPKRWGHRFAGLTARSCGSCCD